MLSPEAKGALLIVAAASLWGSTGIAITFALRDGCSIFTSAAIMIIFALPIILLYGGKEGIRRLSPLLLLYGATVVGAFRMLYAFSVQVNGPGVTSSLLYIAPLVVAVAAPLTIHETPRVSDVLMAIVAFGGAYVASNPEFLITSALGFAIGVSLGIVYAITIIAIRYFYARGYTSKEVLVQSSIGMIVPIAFFFYMTPYAFPKTIWGYVALLWGGIVCIALGLTIYLAGMRNVKAIHASVLATIEPITSIILSRIILGEVLFPIQLLGVAAILLSSLFIMIRRNVF